MTTIPQTTLYHILTPVVTILFCLGLFYIDKDTQNLSDLFKPTNLFALAIYFIPTYIICIFLQGIFKSQPHQKRFFLALGLGIPLGFILVMVLLALNMGRI